VTAAARRGYWFRTAAQWGTCLFDRVDRELFAADGTVKPLAPYDQTASLHESRGAHAPVATRAGEVLWRDDAGHLHRFTDGDEAPDVQRAPHAIAKASRIVSTSHGLYVTALSGNRLERYEEETLTRLSVASTGDEHVIDLASDGYELLFALVDRGGIVQALRIDCAGRVAGAATFDGVRDATAFVYLRRPKRFVVLGDASSRLHWFSAEGGKPLTSLVVAALHPCFGAQALGCDPRGRVFLAGTDDRDRGGDSFVLSFDADGSALGEILLPREDAPATGVAGVHDGLFVTGPRGLLRYGVATRVPDGTAEVRCSVITPLLHSPEREDARRWLRIEAAANLPEGASLAISYAATADAEVCDRLIAIAGDEATLPGYRVTKLLREPGIWQAPVVFHGGKPAPDAAASPGTTFSAPLFDAHVPYVWVCITLSATAGGALPSLNELRVLYPGTSLMDDLPAIYRRTESQPRDFFRAFVGVLESTTQELDSRIGTLASHVHPGTAAGPWLDFVARWLGLPWDDALSEAQKRRIVARARDIAQSRGTRAGLETLLDCLLPGTPPRFRVVDATADVGFATLGGSGCRGSSLPAMLGGSTPWNSRLGATAALGRMRLPCAGSAGDGVGHLAGFVRIDVAASGEERSAWQSWLPALVSEMIPLTARARLRWVSLRALHGAPRVGSHVLSGPPMSRLGSDFVTGVARLPEGRSRITSTGADTGTRLQ
jgi:phage tail-like protein